MSRLLGENNSPAACVRESSACETEFAYIYITDCAQGQLRARAVWGSSQLWVINSWLVFHFSDRLLIVFHFSDSLLIVFHFSNSLLILGPYQREVVKLWAHSVTACWLWAHFICQWQLVDCGPISFLSDRLLIVGPLSDSLWIFDPFQ